MKKALRGTMLVATVVSSAMQAHAGTAVVSPVQQAVNMLDGLAMKVQKEKEAADKAFEELTSYCTSGSANFKFEIKTSTAEIEALNAQIAKDVADADAAGAKISKLSGEIAAAEADLKAATEVRKEEASDFAGEDAELKQIIDMLERAIVILRQHASLLQSSSAKSLSDALSIMVQASAFSAADASKLTSLIQSKSGLESDDGSFGAPEPEVYKGHSKGIVEVLEDLLEKAQSQLSDAQKQEMQARHNFELVKQSLQDEMKYGTKDMDEAKAALQASNEAKAIADSDLAMTQKDLKADKDGLATLEGDCENKEEDYKAAQASRTAELEAIAKAKEAIQESTGGAERRTYSLMTLPASFIQLKRAHSAFAAKARTSAEKKVAMPNPNFEAVHYVRRLAREQHSEVLSLLASRMDSAVQAGSVSGDDPFVKVRGLITDMIERLEKAAGADASHKSYCDEQLAESSAKKSEKTAEVEKLTTKIDSMTARSGQLKEEVAELQKELSELAASMHEMQKMRTEEHERFVKEKSDMEEGIQAVKFALKVLREYYAQDSPTADVGAGKGIIGLLEVVESDFSKTLAEVVTTEAAAAESYDRVTKENAVIKATKDQDVKYKSQEATGLDKSIAETTSDLQGVQAELDAVVEYLSKLEQQCVAKPETYAERKARRAAEIAGLKEALSILESETALVQKSISRRALRSVHAHQ